MLIYKRMLLFINSGNVKISCRKKFFLYVKVHAFSLTPDALF